MDGQERPEGEVGYYHPDHRHSRRYRRIWFPDLGRSAERGEPRVLPSPHGGFLQGPRQQHLDEGSGSWRVWVCFAFKRVYDRRLTPTTRNGQFEYTTTTDENIFVQNGQLHIKPTLQDQKLVETDGSRIDLFQDGICASDKWSNCVSVTNLTNGSIVNPVKSGRISTKKGANIKFGRVEVEAQLPAGDWLWPAIWMLPKDNVYGQWPRSGEIDIMESRGNNYTYAQGGNDIVSSTLHFGPNSANDGWWKNNVKRRALHTTYAKGFHTFGVEWSEKYIFTYIDTRLLQVMYTHFDKSFWTYGQFPLSDSNGTRLEDPWSFTGRQSTPFDQDFYLILNVAVGSTNGWFKDGASGKPWVDQSPTAPKDFWAGRAQWYPTWEKNGQMIVKSVKVCCSDPSTQIQCRNLTDFSLQMWQQKGYNGC